MAATVRGASVVGGICALASSYVELNELSFAVAFREKSGVMSKVPELKSPYLLSQSCAGRQAKNFRR